MIRLLNRLCQPHLGTDTVRVKLPGLEIKVSRDLPPDIPYELTVVIPRAEYRLKQKPPATAKTWEVLLNSITIAHSPRFERTESGKPQAKREGRLAVVR
ncbi:MAG: hypothetical protein PVH64_11895 [Bacillota bacterium]